MVHNAKTKHNKICAKNTLSEKFQIWKSIALAHKYTTPIVLAWYIYFKNKWRLVSSLLVNDAVMQLFSTWEKSANVIYVFK